MQYLYSKKECQSIDSYSINTIGIPAMVLMEKAAMTAAYVIMNRIPDDYRILFVCGTGNNGGDGIAAARILYEKGYNVGITIVGESDRLSEQTDNQLKIAIALNIPILPVTSITDNEFDVIVDALFGLGLSRDIEDVYDKVIDDINESDALVFSIDVPSGIDSTTGAILNNAIKADVTITFGMNKLGLVMFPGCEYAGEVLIGDIGFPAKSLATIDCKTYTYDEEPLKLMPKRPARSHKGTFGKVLVIAGSKQMSGACFLAAKAAYETGAGLVKVISDESNRDLLLGAIPEILFSSDEDISDDIEWADAIVIGPGLSLSDRAEKLVSYVLENSFVPTVIDGDGIRLCRNLTNKLTDNFILTPHVKEMSYLTDLSVDVLKNDILNSTVTTANKWSCTIAQKDAKTVVSNGEESYINTTGNSGMATGGSGDVLAGMIGGLLGQGMQPFEAAKLAVYLHGLSGDYAAKEKSQYSVLASDILNNISKVLASDTKE